MGTQTPFLLIYVSMYFFVIFTSMVTTMYGAMLGDQVDEYEILEMEIHKKDGFCCGCIKGDNDEEGGPLKAGDQRTDAEEQQLIKRRAGRGRRKSLVEQAVDENAKYHDQQEADRKTAANMDLTLRVLVPAVIIIMNIFSIVYLSGALNSVFGTGETPPVGKWSPHEAEVEDGKFHMW